jgi:two-component system OmpR family sensor kinase/two-component system sensor histidine kinase BaeS
MRLRLILSFVFVTLVAIASVVLIARRTTAREVQAFMYRGSMVEVDSLVEDLEAYYSAMGSWDGVESLLPGSGTGQGRGQGAQSQGMGSMAMMHNQRLALADASGQVVLDTSGETTGTTLSATELEAAQPLRAGLRIVGYLQVESGMIMTGTAGTFLLERLNRAALIAGTIAGGIALLLALLLADRLLKPVQQLTSAARQMAQGDLAQRVPVHGADELAELGQAFNHMAGSLQKAEQNRQAMTADIAHELRNPLAVQRAHLEALQDGIYPPTPENLQPVLEQNRLLERLVDDLRTLALADAGQLRLERTPTDLGGLAQRIVARFNPDAAGRGLQLSLVLAPEVQAAPLVVNIDPIRIEQILGNLLSNAERHTPPGGTIAVQVQRAGAAAQISVRDSGLGIPEESLAHIFERFYRADRSRSRSEGGSGLGLAIARQLAEAHGGSLSAANAPEGGAVFTLKLPI